MKQESLEYVLEELIDKESLSTVLDTLASICFGKAEHLATNWQDTESAKAWTKIGNTVFTCADKAKSVLK